MVWREEDADSSRWIIATLLFFLLGLLVARICIMKNKEAFFKKIMDKKFEGFLGGAKCFPKKTRSPLLIVSKVSFLKSRMIEVILLRSSFLKSRFTTPHCVLRRFSEIGCLDSQIPRNQFFLNYWEITYHLCRKRPNTELHLLLGKSNAFTFSKRH